MSQTTVVERLEIDWPTTGTRLAFEAVPAGATLRVVEGRDDYEKLDLVRFDLLNAR